MNSRNSLHKRSIQAQGDDLVNRIILNDTGQWPPFQVVVSVFLPKKPVTKPATTPAKPVVCARVLQMIGQQRLQHCHTHGAAGAAIYLPGKKRSKK